ncbi:MAG TPA: discoidin domain-containing protein, partial [Vicinamibacterales bacterium]|nr:discoidin domain-containing protein [Vicinamibacterales bacterium]
FGLAWIGLGLSNGYYLLFFCVLASMWIGWFFSARQDRSRLMRLLAAWAIAATLITPVIIGYHTALDAFRGERTLTEIRSFSADVSAFAATSPLVWAWRRLSVVHQAEQQLFPGIVSIVLFAAALVIIPRGDRVSEAARRARIAIVIVATTVVTLAVVAAVGGPIRTRLLTIDSISKPGAIVIWLTVVAIALGSRARRAFATRSPLAFYVIATVVMFVLALGPEPTLNGTPIWYKPPYAWLIELPGFGVIRVAARFAMLGELCLAVVAALAWAAMTRDLRPRYLTLATAGCVAVLLADSWVVGLPLPAVPPRLDALEAIAGGTPVLELPVGVLEDTAAMYRAMFHGAPLVNGYSGFTPAHYDILRAALDAGDPAVLDAFASRRDLIVVVNESPAKRWTEYFGHADAAERLTGDSAHAIFRLRASPWRAPALGAPIPIVSIDDVPSSGLQQLSDNNLLTRWDSGAPQHGHEVITLDLGRPQRVGGVELSAGPYLGEVARRLTVQLSVDHDAWSSVAIASSFARAVDSAIRDPKRIAMVFDFPARAARYIRLRQTGVDSTYHWSIAELLVFAAE